MTIVPDPDLLRDLGIMVVAATAFALLARPFRAPGMVAFLAVGVILGPAAGLLEVTEATEGLAEVGIIFLLFLLGLELSVHQIKAVGKTAFVVGGAQMALSAGLAFGISVLFGLPTTHALFMGLALMYSSTVVVVKLLEKKGDVDARYGEISVGILLVQDLAVVVVLALVTALGAHGGGGTGQEMAEAGGENGLPPLAEAALAVGGLLLLAGATAAAARYLLPRLFHWVSHYPEALFIWSLGWCFLFVAAAELLDLAPEVGAFLAGIGLAQLPYHEHLYRRVHPLMNFFLALFFVYLGLQIEPVAALQEWPLLVALILSVMVGKPIIFLFLLPRMGHGDRTTFLSSLTLSQSSEFSLILGALALGLGLIDETVFSVLGIIALMTMALSAYLIQYNRPIAARWGHVSRWFGARPEDDQDETSPAETGPRETTDEGTGREARDGEQRSGHIIIVGMNALAELLAERLKERGESLVIVEQRLEKVEALPYETVLGDADYEPVLEAARIREARLLISTIEDEELNSLLVYRCHQHGVPCSMHGYDRTIVKELRIEGADHLIESTEAEREAVLQALGREGVMRS